MLKHKSKRPTIEDNPDVPRPYETWLNERMANSVLNNALALMSYDTTMRLNRWLDRDDMVQEVYQKMWEVAPLYDKTKAKFSTFLYFSVRRHLNIVAVNQSFIRVPAGVNDNTRPGVEQSREFAMKSNRICFQFTPKPNEDDWGGLMMLLASREPEAGGEAVNASWVIQDGLRKLREDDRKLLTACYLDERTLKDIGCEMGVSRERVRQKRNAALERLRKTLNEMGHGE